MNLDDTQDDPSPEPSPIDVTEQLKFDGRHPFTQGWLAYFYGAAWDYTPTNPYANESPARAAWDSGFREHAKAATTASGLSARLVDP